MAAKKVIAWEHRIQRKKNGEPYSSLLNAQVALTHDPKWEGVLAFDEFVGDIVTRKLPPWPKDTRPTHFATGIWTDRDTARAAAWLARYHDIRCDTRIVEEALHMVAECNSFHPIRDWLHALAWDRCHRIDDVFHRLAGAPDTPYAREVSKNFFIGAVARIMKPGCQLDSLPIFEGLQGAGKTSFFQVLFGADWFLNSNIDITSKDGYQVLQRKWCVELGELDALRRVELTRVKLYISQRVDTYRPSYARRSRDFPRQVVFAGTTNQDAYLQDGTGARRFWPLEVKGVLLPDGGFGIDLQTLAVEREQLFAEAVVRYKKGEPWHITDKKLRDDAALVAEEKRQTDPWEMMIAKWLFRKRKEDDGKKFIARGLSTHDVLTMALGRPDKGKINKSDEMRAAAALKAIGYTETDRILRWGVRTRVYWKPGSMRLSRPVRIAEVVQIGSRKTGSGQPGQPKNVSLYKKSSREDT